MTIQESGCLFKSSMKYIFKVLCLLLSAQFGGIFGNMVFSYFPSGTIKIAIEIINPKSILTVIYMGISTPIANVFLISWFLSILTILAFRVRVWIYGIPFLLFALATFFLLNAWRI